MNNAIRSQFRDWHIKPESWLHRSEVRARRGAFSKLKTPQDFLEFSKETSTNISKFQLEIFAVTIDKIQMQAMYPNEFTPYLKRDPLDLAITFMTERVAKCAVQCGFQIDEIVWEWGGKRENAQRKTIFKYRVEHGTEYLNREDLKPVFLNSNHRFVKKKQDPPVAGLETADWITRVFNSKGMGGADYDEEFELYRSKVWLGLEPGSPGQTGFKTFPLDTHRRVLECPIDIHSLLTRKAHGAYK